MATQRLPEAGNPVRQRATAPTEWFAVDVRCEVPVAFESLRRLCIAMETEIAPDEMAELSAEHQPEWNRLFPGRFDAPPLEEIALSPSERRLHRESEQVFR